MELWRAKYDAVEPGTGVRIALIDTGILTEALATADGLLEGATINEDEAEATALDITHPSHDANESSERAPDIDPGLLRRPGHGTAAASVIVGGPVRRPWLRRMTALFSPRARAIRLPSSRSVTTPV